MDTLLDACRFVLEDQGEAQSSYWLASIMDEMKLWKASESQVRRVIDSDIKKSGESSPFVKVTSVPGQKNCTKFARMLRWQ